MKHKIGFIFPGQGAQYVGMGKDFYDQFPIAQALFNQADALLGKPFSQEIFSGSQENLTETKNSQVAIYIMSLAVYRVLTDLYPCLVPFATGGLSLGEYSALVASNKLSFEEGLFLVSKRAALMQEACELAPGSMQVVLGMEEKAIHEVFAPLNLKTLCVANINCPGQIVIAGTKEELEIGSLALKQAGAKRVLPLDVSGAFHSGLMQSARDGLTPYLQNVSLHDSQTAFFMNTPGIRVQDLQEIRLNLVRQVTEPVRWQKCVESMVQEGVTHFIEVGCGKTLQGMNKRIGLTVPTFSVEKVEDLEALRQKEEFSDVF